MMHPERVTGDPVILDFPGHATFVVPTSSRLGPELPGAIMRALGAVHEALAGKAPGHNVVYYKDINPEGVVPMECGVLAPSPLPAAGRAFPSGLPAGRVAFLTHVGPYSGLNATHERIAAWCAANGHVDVGVAWEEYDDPADDPASLRTDVYRIVQ